MKIWQWIVLGIIILVIIIYIFWYYNEREDIPIYFELRIKGSQDKVPYMRYYYKTGNFYSEKPGEINPKEITKKEYKQTYLNALKGSVYDVFDSLNML